MSEPRYIDRPPRIQPEIPSKKVEVPAPPTKEDDSGSLLMQVALPAITVVGFVVVAAISGGGGDTMLLVIPMFLSVIAAAAFAMYIHKRQEKIRERQVAAYQERLLELRQEMINSHDIQRRFYHYNYPETATVLQIANDIYRDTENRQAAIRSGSRLWERRLTDEDFGFVRLGIGTIPSTTIYQFNGNENFEDDLTREAMRLDTDSRFVTDAPVTIALRPIPKKPQDESESKPVQEEPLPPWPTPETHATGIAGNPSDVHHFAWALLAHYVTFHAATDTRLFILGPRRQPWEWAYSLAHCQPDEQNDYLCFEDEHPAEEQAADEDTEDAVGRYLENLRKVLAQRELRLKDTENAGSDNRDPRIPFLLVLVDLLAPAAPNSPLADLEGDAAISILLQQGADLGASIIFLVPDRSKVPSGCTAVIEIESVNAQNDAAALPYFRYAEVGVNTWRYVGRADTIARQETVADLAHKLEALDARRSYGGSLTASVPFMEMVGEPSLDSLRESTRQRWRRNLDPDSADWLKVKVGMMSGNKPRTLVFSAKRDGVHGMVAGSTGSGKSELLISMIAGLAISFDPATLNFVLVDYKGGGAFKPFDKLPHCVDIITNLQGAGVVRMFTAISSELERRQKLNGRTDTKDIVEYRRRGYHLTDEPYPFLFIIIDEFAEMIAENPEFKKELERITRLGRAQGVSLILAAQRPSGVTDQMRSNIKFRICLRVEGPEESREMLRRSDAAYLPNSIPGRGYLQVGNDNIDSIQVAYTGDKYVDPANRRRMNVIWPQRKRRSSDEDEDAPKIFQAIIAMLDKLAVADRIAAQKAPWPKHLPDNLSLSAELERDKLDEIDKIMLGQELGSALSLNPAVNRWLNNEPAWDGVKWNKYAMRPVVGLIDNPYEAKRLPLVIDLPRGHVVMFGASGWGKTNFLRTLIVSLAATHSPRELNIFILDLGGRNLLALKEFPHVGAVVLPDEEGYEEQVKQLLRELAGVVEKRKKLLGDEGVADIYQYNASHPAAPLPAILVALDNFIEFKESFEQQKDKDDGLLEQFMGLTRESRAYGIHFVLTISNLNALPNKMYNIFTERLTLKLSEPGDYRTLTGAGVPELEDIPGRGYIKYGREALTFQIALPVDLKRESTDNPAAVETRELRELAAVMQKAGGEASDEMALLRVEPLPRTVSYRQMLARGNNIPQTEEFMEALRDRTRDRWEQSTTAESADWLEVSLGMMSGNRPRVLQMAAPRDGVHGMIAGGTGSGKSELLMTMIVGLALNYDPSILNFVLVDYKGGGAFKPFADLPHVVDIITNLHVSGVVRMFTAINSELKRRQKLNADTGTKDIIDYRQKGLHLLPQWGPYPHLFIIIDEYAEMISAMPEFKQELDSITRVGRASGVNLILAAQRPTGVTDQMRSNIKFRICLRVEGIDESREMLRRPDAAFLPSGLPGRGYLQIGNEDIELIQMGFTGEKEPEKKKVGVVWAGRPERDNGVVVGDVPRLYDRVVSMAADIMKEIDDPLRQVRRPWPDFLPGYVSLQTPLKTDYLSAADVDHLRLGAPPRSDEPMISLNPAVTDWQNGDGAWSGIDWKRHAMRPVVGLADNPNDANQVPLILNFPQVHVALMGDSGWGKTTFLRSVIIGLAATHSPAEVNFFIVDLGGRNFNVFRPLPHVADIIMTDDEEFEERIYRLVDRLNREIERRQPLFSATDSTDLFDYNSKKPETILPAILVLIDNFAGLNEAFEAMIHDDLIPLARNGRAYGIHFIVTANAPNAITGKLYNLFGERMTLKLSDSSQYMDIVGRGAVELESIPGRGYIRVGRQPLEFQTALPVGLAVDRGDSTLEADTLRRLVRNMNEAWQGGRPANIAILPKEVSLTEVLAAAVAPPKSMIGVLGLGANLKPALIDLPKNGPHFVVVGPPLSGKTTALRNMVISMAANYPPQQASLILVDMQRKFHNYDGRRNLGELPHVLAAATDLEGFAAIAARLQAEYVYAEAQRRPRRIFVFIDNFDDLSDELSAGSNSDLGRDAAQLARRFGPEGLHFIVAGAMDSLSDLRRRIEANNYGIGLRTGDALQKLSVMRVPSNMRDTELALGRGYVSKSGQISLVQVATPYTDIGDDPPAEEAERTAYALDAWVETIERRYSGESAVWLAPEPEETAAEEAGESTPEAASGATAVASHQVLAILRKVVEKEMQRQGLMSFDLDDRNVLDMAKSLFNENGEDGDVGEDDEDDEIYSDEDLALDLDFETDDILNAREQPENS